jgi:hypothetical protein
MLRNPRGGVENVEEMWRAGIRWLAFNVRDYSVADWAIVRQRCHQYGVKYLPWARIGNPGDSRETALEWCQRLMYIADAMREDQGLPDSLAIVNAETEIKPVALGGVVTPDEVARIIGKRRQVAISTEGRLYHHNWVPLVQQPLLLQIFPTDMGIFQSATAVLAETLADVARARMYGFLNVGVTYQAYHEAPPSIYPFRSGSAWNIYAGDDVGIGNWSRWTSV